MDYNFNIYNSFAQFLLNKHDLLSIYLIFYMLYSIQSVKDFVLLLESKPYERL